MRIIRATAFIACLSALCLAGTAHADSYSKAVQKSCAADYHKYCGDYGLETARACGRAWTGTASRCRRAV